MPDMEIDALPLEYEQEHGTAQSSASSPDLFSTKRRVVIPLLAGDKWVTLSAEFPLTEQQWEQLMSVLEAMKPGLVAYEDCPLKEGR